MRLSGIKLHRNSIRYKLILSVLIMTIPMIGMLLYNNFYAIDVVREQVADSYHNTLKLYMSQIDSDLNDIDAYLNTLAGSGYDLISLKMAEDDDQYYLSKVYIYNKLMNDIALYESLDSFFVYIKDRRDFMDVHSSGVTFMEKEEVQHTIIDMIHEQDLPQGYRTKRWTNVPIGEQNILMNILKSGDIYLGAWIRIDKLLKPLQALDLGEDGAVLIVDEQGRIVKNNDSVLDAGIEFRASLDDYYISGTDRKYLVVSTASYRGTFYLSALIPERNILSNLPYLQRIIWLIFIGAIIFIPIGLYYMKRSLLNPLKRILQAMGRIRGGDWSIRVDLTGQAEEFKTLGYSFNTMMDEIQRLRVNVFEEQLNKQREELQRLQLQVNPHFFLNALNIIYNLAKVRNYSLIMEMTRALVYYFRFLFRSNTSFVKLKDELEHTRNYLRIQTLRFPEKLTYDIKVPDYLTDTPIPPLVIQTFVENAIKHAVSMEDPIHIAVEISFADEQEASKIKILVRDSGRGFEQEVLRKLQAGENITNERGEHTGIWNVQRRLKLLYKQGVTIRFDNDHKFGGAMVEITLPAHPDR